MALFSYSRVFWIMFDSWCNNYGGSKYRQSYLLVEDFCVYIHNRYWLSFLYCNLCLILASVSDYIWELALLTFHCLVRDATEYSWDQCLCLQVCWCLAAASVACVTAWSTGMMDSSAVPLICRLCSCGRRDSVQEDLVSWVLLPCHVLLYSWIFLLPVAGGGLELLAPLDFLCGSAGKESTYNVGNVGSISGLGRSPGEGKGYPL